MLTEQPRAPHPVWEDSGEILPLPHILYLSTHYV